jgi:glycosyltransferase involved in cell wall biosynthesis
MGMRIVHVVLSLEVGGQERLILALSRALAARGHDVQVIALTPGGTLAPDFGSIPVHVCAKNAARFDPWLVARLARLFRGLFSGARPDVVHTHNAGPLIYAATAARLARVATVVHTKHGDATYARGAAALARAAAKTVSAFVAVSEATAVAARQRERPRPRTLRVVPNGIPLADFARDPSARARIRAELGIPMDAVVIGTVGRLVAEKDYPLLVRAAAPLLGAKTRLVVVGEGPERDAVAAASASPHVTLTGYRSDVAAFFSAFDVFALSSRTEGLPLVVPEAMASGLPVVATRVGGLPGVVPDAVGALVPPGDEEALRGALAAFVEDAESRAARGRAARDYAQARFSLDRMCADYEAIYGGGDGQSA